MMPATILYALIMVTNGQMTVKSGLTKDECLRAANYAQGNACMPMSPSAGMTLIIQLRGTYSTMDFTREPPACARLLRSLSLPAACVPLAQPVQGCLS
jgi:hypothetical protein